MDLGNTMEIKLNAVNAVQVSDIIKQVYEALRVKGYDPISQIVGYILSGDPTYITSYIGARCLIVNIERDELLEELTKSYIANL